MSSLLLNNYELVLQSKYLGKIPVDVYKSKRTGLHVALAQAPGPVVNCHLVLTTEIETNDGLPHTLEHLVFMGSKLYPFKGALDLLSMKVFSIGGTNAWTEQDHTSYTVKTIGEVGMQNFLPIYGDHLINPLLTRENYQSEVYQVTADGEETGVVYSEIQNHENDLDHLVDLELKRQCFPTLPSFYSDYGGRMREVRELCSLKRVQDYHKKFYHLRNMWILLCGNIDVEQMLKSVEVLDAAEGNAPPATFERPFIGMKAPDITRDRNDPTTVRGPSESDDEGVVGIGFLTRPAWDLEFMTALSVLSTYLTATTSAPLKKEMVLCPDPYCDSVSISTVELPRCQITVDFSAVPVKKLGAVTDKFFNVLRSSTTPEKFDMERIKFIIDHKIKKLYAKLEKDVSKPVFSELIGYQLFAQSLDDQSHFDNVMNPIPLLNELRDKPAEYWAGLVTEIFKDECAVVIGKPDTKLGEKIGKEEAERLAKLKEQSVKRQKLDDVRKIEEASSCSALKSMFNDIDFDPNIKTFNVETSVLPPFAQNGHPDLLGNLPFTTICHDMKDTKFSRFYFTFDLRDVPLRLRKYLMLFDSLLSKSSAMVDGKVLSDTEVANLMVKELMEVSFGPGFLGAYKHYYHFYIETSNNEFNLVPRWARILLSDTIFDKDTILSICKNLANGASTSKRDAHTMCGIALRTLNIVKEHESRFYDDVVLEQFNRSLVKKLEGPDGEAVAKQILDDLNELRQAIVSSPVNAHLACNLKELDNVQKIKPNAWDFIKQSKAPAEKLTIDFERDVNAFKQNRTGSRVMKLDSCDASFLMGEVKVDFEYGGPAHVALLIFAQYFSMVEGVLWCAVRGEGYAYGAGIGIAVNSLLLEWDLYRCSRPKLAYQTMKDAVLNVFASEDKIDKVLFDLSKRAAVSSLMSRYETLKGTAGLTAFDCFRGKSIADIKELTDNVWKANLSDSFKDAKPHFIKLFDGTSGVVSAVCPRNKLDEIKETFKDIETVTIADLQYTPE